MLKKWEDLPAFMQCQEVRPYYDILKEKAFQLVLKRIFDFLLALILLIILALPMLLIAVLIRLDSKGSPIYRQERVTAYGKRFRIHKFRTMTVGADQQGALLTAKADQRITRIGMSLRRFHVDEMPQILDVLEGNMSFVGTRAEVPLYVEQYKPEYYATLLMPAGITSEATIRYKDEYKQLNDAQDCERVYLDTILPAKMKWNLASVRRFRFLREILTIIRTVLAVCGKEYS
jgi:lipopolysaccharide/colanic/teichoic acid biosynthesis glycosyltransferase